MRSKPSAKAHQSRIAHARARGGQRHEPRRSVPAGQNNLHEPSLDFRLKSMKRKIYGNAFAGQKSLAAGWNIAAESDSGAHQRHALLFALKLPGYRIVTP